MPESSIFLSAWSTMTSGSLIGNMFRKTKHCRRWYCALAVPSLPVEAPIMATGFWLKALSCGGLEAQSIAFLSVPGIE